MKNRWTAGDWRWNCDWAVAERRRGRRADLEAIVALMDWYQRNWANGDDASTRRGSIIKCVFSLAVDVRFPNSV